jgi:anti-sigma regulatory factor (Ser/Thr protein kinase)
MYRGPDELISSCLAIVQDGRARDARVLFLISAHKIAALHGALNGSSQDVALVAVDEHGRNPARITTMLDSFQATASGRHCVGVNEPVFAGRSRAALAEAQFADSVLNSAHLRSWPLSIVCLYDAGTLDEPSLATMRRSHPAIRGQQDNDSFDAGLAAVTFAAPLEPAPDDAQWRDVYGDELVATRRYVREQGSARQLSGERLEDLVLAAHEIVTNSVRHGGGQCRVGLWSDDDSVVCEIRDDGAITDPLLGRLAPPPGALRGRGLWLANQLCDLVQIRSGSHGTMVRLHVDHMS